MGTLVDTPQGRLPLTPALRDSQLGLACRLSRCCRAIDDVLFIDMSRREREWAKSRMYPPDLELKTVCMSPGPIQYLDLEITHDRGGFHTSLYDKRDALREAGKMDFVRRFPHPSSVLADVCKYGCLVSFLHRISRCDGRTGDFITHAATRMTEMYQDGYDGPKLVRKLRRFMQSYHRPTCRWRAVSAQIQRAFVLQSCGVARAQHGDPFPEGTVMAVRGQATA